MPKVLRTLKSELELPRHLRWFGSGWLSGAGALLCGIVALALVVSLRFPHLATPQIAAVTGTFAFRFFLHAVLMLGYGLALLSLLLRPGPNRRQIGTVAAAIAAR
jgi:hypothetical protein